MQSRGPGVESMSDGLIKSDDAAALGVRKLVVKLILQVEKLVGRVITRGTYVVWCSPTFFTF